MKALLVLNTTELSYFLLSLPILILSIIQIVRYTVKYIPRSYVFNTKGFLFGTSLAISCAIALMNWEVVAKEDPYVTEPIDTETVHQIPQTFQKEEPKTLPPPPKPIKAQPDISKLKLVDDLVEKTKVEPVLDTSSYEPAPVVAVTSTKAAPMVAPKIEEPEEKPFVIIPEQMPRFPGCEHLDGTHKEKEICSKTELFTYIAQNLKYPPLARENGIQGMVVIRFIVSKEGKISDYSILRDIGAGCGEAALKVVKSMNDMPESWIPGKQRGRPVNVQYTLPVKFKLQ